jgi:uncharacterized protein (DUF2141 family)
MSRIFRIFALLMSLTLGSLATHVFGEELYRVAGTIGGLSGDSPVLVWLYTENTWENSLAPYRQIRISPSQIRNGYAHFYFDVPEGIYGITAFEDEDNNGTISRALGFMWPTEPYGFYRDFEPSGAGKPAFSNFRFRLNRNMSNAHIRMSN